MSKRLANRRKQETSVMEVSIGGMSCTGCEQTIQNNVGKLEGIKSVKASFTTGTAIIEYFQGMVDTTKIGEAIKGSGYTVKKFIALTKEEVGKLNLSEFSFQPKSEMNRK